MNRRAVSVNLLRALACSALGTSAHAQNAAPGMKPEGSTAGLSDAVKAHIRDTMTAGAQSLAISRIAQAKLRHPMGRQFADFEVAEQDGIADVLKGRLTPGAKPSGTVVPPTDAEVEAGLDADGRAAAAKFRDMAAGPDFERAYVQAQVEGHRKLLDIQDAYLKVADDEAETDIAKLAKGRIQEHLVILGDIGKHLG